ncbi:MAG TPA: fusaric acid resistance protein, partial [Pantoea sp.]|nr:fusaric acid resistance protein [Pantoea sp.]
VCGVLLAWLAFQLLRPQSDARRSRRHIRALRLAFLDQLRRRPRLSESRFESQIYHRISQLSHSRDEQARVWLLRWGVVLLNCSHIVWQLRQWQADSATLMEVRDSSLQNLQRIISSRGVQHSSLDQILTELERMIATLLALGSNEASELAGIIWRLRCSLAQLQQAVPG